MQSFRRFDRSTTLFIGLLMVSFLLATLDVRAGGAGFGENLRDAAQAIFSPIQKGAAAVVRPVTGVVDYLSDVAGLREENARLRQQIDELEALVANAAALERENAVLNDLLGLEIPEDLTAVTARIVANGTNDFDQIRFIDKGSASGVAKGQAVVDENGLVGRIDLVSQNSARVRLITDPRLGVGVRNLETNETGWVEGQGIGNDLRLEMFGAEQPVTEGDLIVTDGSRFPAGITVGRAGETAVVEAGFALFAQVEPAISVSSLDFVKVIIGWSPLDAVEDEPQQTVIPSPGVERE